MQNVLREKDIRKIVFMSIFSNKACTSYLYVGLRNIILKGSNYYKK